MQFLKQFNSMTYRIFLRYHNYLQHCNIILSKYDNYYYIAQKAHIIKHHFYSATTTVDLRPSVIRGNQLVARSTEPVAAATLGRGLCPAVINVQHKIC